jgi:hypothetical protein
VVGEDQTLAATGEHGTLRSGNQSSSPSSAGWLLDASWTALSGGAQPGALWETTAGPVRSGRGGETMAAWKSFSSPWFSVIAPGLRDRPPAGLGTGAGAETRGGRAVAWPGGAVHPQCKGRQVNGRLSGNRAGRSSLIQRAPS